MGELRRSLLVLVLGLLTPGCTVVAPAPRAPAAPVDEALTGLLEERNRLHAYRSSVPAPGAADLLILGGVHASLRTGEEITPGTFDLPFTLEGVLREGDSLLLECSRDLMAPYETTVRGVRVRVAGIDCSRELKVAHLRETIHDVVLAVARARLESGTPLHPFHRWLIHEDLRLAQHDDAGLTRLLRERPALSQADHERHRQLVANVVEEARRLPPRRRAVLIVGERHVTGYGSSLLQSLEQAGIRYAAYLTGVPGPPRASAAAVVALDATLKGDRLAAPAPGSSPRTGENPALASPRPRSAGVVYFEEQVLPRYVRERTAEGVPAYQGSCEGALSQYP